MELVILKALPRPADDPVQPVQDPAIHGGQLVIGQVVHAGLEIVQVAQQEPRRVANAAVRLRQALEDVHGDAHVVAVVRGGHPQAQYLRPKLIDDLLGRDGVAQGLGHLAALAVQGEAVGQDLLIGRLALDGHCREERRLEPAAVLVAALQIHLAGPGEAEVLVQHRHVGNAAVEPHIQDVAVLLHVVAAAVVAHGLVPQQGLQALAPPDGGAVRRVLHLLRQQTDTVRRQGESPAVFAAQRGHRHAPHPLAADAPVRPAAHHVVDAVVAPVGDPLYVVVDEFQGLVLELRHVDEPLVRGPEDDGVLAAPAVRVAVHDLPAPQQASPGLDELKGLLPALLQGHPAHDGRVRQVMSGAVHGVVYLYVVAHAGLIVLHAVAGGRVDAARAGVQDDVVRQDKLDIPFIVERVDRRQSLQFRALHDEERFAHAQARVPAHGVLQPHGQEVNPIHIRTQGDALPPRTPHALVEAILILRVQGHRHAGGQGPGRRGPYHHIHILARKLRELLRDLRHGISHIDGGRALVPILDLPRRQGRLAVRAPVHGLQTPVDEPLLHHVGKGMELPMFKLRVQREVGMVPLGQHTEALELLPLHVQIMERRGLAALSQIHGVDARSQFGEPAIPQGAQLDGQPVGVPAGNIGCVPAHHHPGLEQQVLQYLVEARADVNVAVGVGGAVVKHEPLPLLARIDSLVVDVMLPPEL